MSESIIHSQQEVGYKHAGGVVTPGSHQNTSVLLHNKEREREEFTPQ